MLMSDSLRACFVLLGTLETRVKTRAGRGARALAARGARALGACNSSWCVVHTGDRMVKISYKCRDGDLNLYVVSLLFWAVLGCRGACSVQRHRAAPRRRVQTTAGPESGNRTIAP